MNQLQFLAQTVLEGLHYPSNPWNLPVSLGLVDLLRMGMAIHVSLSVAKFDGFEDLEDQVILSL